MFFFRSIRQAIRDRKQVEADRDFWKNRAEMYERKLQDRTDFYVEREFRLIDRFLTSQAKTHAITDEIRAKQLPPDTVMQAKLEAYLEEKKQEMIEMARDAGMDEQIALRDFDRNRDFFIMDFQQDSSVM